ncbi:MAG: twin-arginine translocation signal domain-containing protein [Acidimicrobiales bacterium]|jgi:hypothetical protein|nr:twin-arginine translocation signal domain-containing protein [Acidimicrobiales bacterium]
MTVGTTAANDGADIPSRRDLLKKSAVVAGAAWLAPVIVTTPAHAQGTKLPPTIPTPLADSSSCVCGNNTPISVPWPTGSQVGDLILCVHSMESQTVNPSPTPFVTGNNGVVATPVNMAVPGTGVNPQRYDGGNGARVSTFLYYVQRPATGTGVTFNSNDNAVGKESACLIALRGVDIALPQGQADSDSGGSAPATSGPIDTPAASAVVFVGVGEDGNINVGDPTVTQTTGSGTWFNLGTITNGNASGCGDSRPDIFLSYGSYAAASTGINVSQTPTPSTEWNAFLVAFLG